LSRFNYFYNNWLDVGPLFKPENVGSSSKVTYLPVNLDQSFFENLNFTETSLRNYRIQAAERCANLLGNNIALCLSGGIDSQCMAQAFKEANIPFTAYILNFNKELNIQDVNHARLYCRVNNINLEEIQFDVVNFLTRENYDYGIKYKSSSPHFNTHYKLFDIIKSRGHSGVCCGGVTPFLRNGAFGSNFLRNPFNFITYSEISEFYCQGSFLSFSPELAWTIGLLTPKLDYSSSQNLEAMSQSTIYDLNDNRYGKKCQAYMKEGFKIIPQDKKYTGFEFVKLYFQNKTGNPLEFENNFRYPLERIHNTNRFDSEFDISEDVMTTILGIHSNNMASC